MAADPFLEAHRVGERCFELGGCFSPASVRDQMLRACAFARRAFDDRLIDTAGRTLIVVGAGSTGLTAAVAAATLGVKVRVLEKRPHSMFRLAQCSTRDIDPTLYDWPLDHWYPGHFPIAGAPMPLEWDQGRADVVAAQWQSTMAALDPAVQANLTIDFSSHPDLGSPPKPPVPDPITGLVDVVVIDGSGNRRTETCGALVSCVGWEAEIVGVQGSPFKGFEFWENDPLQRPLVTPTGKPARVLVGGGGDGALQDFIRIATHRSAREVLEELMNSHPAVARAIETVRGVLKDAEDQAQRALSWGSGDADDDPVLDRLERAHATAVSWLLSSNTVRGKQVEAVVLQMLVTPFPAITLAHTKSFFHSCYGLNRFLTLLIVKVLNSRKPTRPEEDPGGPSGVRLMDTRVLSVQGTTTPALTAHQCAGQPSLCHLKPHEVRLQIGNAVQRTQIFDVLVFRFGLSQNRTLFQIVPGRPRHLLPYFLE